MRQRSRKGLSLTYKLTIILLVLTLVPMTLVAVSSLNTFSSIDNTVSSAIEDIKDTAIDESRQTKTAAISQTKENVVEILKNNLKTRRDERIDKYSEILESVKRDAEIVAAYTEKNWEHIDGSTYSSTFEGMVWAGPNNTDAKRQNYRTQINKLSRVGELLEQMDDGNALTSLTYFGTRDDNVVTSKDIESALESIPTGFSNTERPWYVAVRDKKQTVWTNSYVDANTKNLVTTVASPVQPGDEFLGVIGFDVTLGVLSNDILETDPGFSFLLDSSGEAIIYPGMKAPNKTVYAERTFRGTNFLEDNVSEGLRLLAEEMVAGEKGIREVTIEGKRSFVAYGPLQQNDWSVAVAVPVEETLAPITGIEENLGDRLDVMAQQIESKADYVKDGLYTTIQGTMYRFLLLFGFFILIVIGSGVYVSRRVTNPLIELQEKAESISKGGIAKEVEIHTGDEIEQLAHSFNRIMRTIKILQRRDAPPGEEYVTDRDSK